MTRKTSISLAQLGRREFLAYSGTALIALSSGLRPAQAQQLARPSSPITLSVLDVGGILEVAQGQFENYKAAHPEMVADIVYTKAPAPELASKLQVQESAGRLDMDIILTGTDAMAAGLAMDVYEELLPKYGSYFPDLSNRQYPGARALQAMAGGHGIVNVYYPGGPVLFFMPGLENVPTTPQELLAWAKANPSKFSYARPVNSGPGRTFVMALPYMLGDSNPLDPVKGWEKTWAYLKEINEFIDYYPSGTAQLMTEFAQGVRTLLVTTTGFDINPRALGVVPKEAVIAPFKNFHWVAGGNFMVVPKGLPEDRLAVVLDFIAFALQPKQQGVLFDTGYLYPGPSIQGVTIADAPEKSRKIIEEYDRPEYDDLIANNPIEPPLDAVNMVKMFSMWDEQIGATK